MGKEVLLSILIPTYNGASKYLDKTMEALIEGVQLCEEGIIEVIISSNASTDNTIEFLKQYDKYPFIKCYSNETNIGFARNIVRLTDEYSKGKFGWVIGDDDIIVPCYIPIVVERLKKGKIDYLSVGFKFVEIGNYTLETNNITNINDCTFAEALETGKKGNILGTFMSSAIVRLSTFRNIPKDAITSKFDSYPSIFPNAYVNATAFHNSYCAFTNDEVVLSFLHDKGWNTDDNNYKIRLHTIPDLYDYITSLGIKELELKNSYKRILFGAVRIGYGRLLSGKRVDKRFFAILLKSFAYPSVHKNIMIHLFESIKRRMIRR